MSTYELAKAILPHLVTTDFSTNPHSMARRAYDYAKAFEDVTPEYVPALGTTDFGMTDEFPMWDDLGMNLSSANIDGLVVMDWDSMPGDGIDLNNFGNVTVNFSGVTSGVTSGCLDNMNNFWQDDIIKTEQVQPEYVVNGNVDVSGVNMKF